MEKDIGKINKNDTTDILLRIDDFANKKGLTIREFVTSDRYTGFTKSGVKIMASNFPKFKEMINSITEEDMKEESPEEKEQLESGQETLKEERPESYGEEGLPDYWFLKVRLKIYATSPPKPLKTILIILIYEKK